MNNAFVVRTAVERAAYSFDKCFDYAVPEPLRSQCSAGKRVLVPFGRGNTRRMGIITEITESNNDSLKEIIAVLDKEPVLTPELLSQLRQWNDEAQAEGRTLAEHALRWILRQRGVTSVLVGASSTQQLEKNLRSVR